MLGGGGGKKLLYQDYSLIKKTGSNHRAIIKCMSEQYRVVSKAEKKSKM